MIACNSWFTPSDRVTRCVTPTDPTFSRFDTIPACDGDTDRQTERQTRNPAKASGGRPYETGSRNMAATQKINFLTPVSYSLHQTLFR